MSKQNPRLQALRQRIDEYNELNPPTPFRSEYRKMTEEEAQVYRSIVGRQCQPLGDTLYMIGRTVTGEQGWSDFNKAVMRKMAHL